MATAVLLIVVNLVLSLYLFIEGARASTRKQAVHPFWLQVARSAVALCWTAVFSYLLYIELAGITVDGLGGPVDKILVTYNRPLMTLTLAVMVGQSIIMRKR